MKEKSEEKSAEARSKRTGSKIGVLLGVISGLAITVGLLMVFLFGIPKVSRDPTKYTALLSDRKDLRTGFVVFPPEIPASGMTNGPAFYYDYRADVLDPTAEVYLRCTYDDADYAAELDRLEHYEHRADEWPDVDGPHRFLRDEEGWFSYPAYVAIRADDHAWEYALITGDREITYVYFAFRQPGKFRAVPDDCLPEPFEAFLYQETGRYSIYEFREDTNSNYFYITYDRTGED